MNYSPRIIKKEASFKPASFLINLFKTIILLSFINISTLFCSELYPYWFLYQSEYPEITIGYSNKGFLAEKDAEQRYVMYKGCIAKGEVYHFQNWDIKHSNYYYDYSLNDLKAIHKQLYKIAQFSVTLLTKDYIVAYCKHLPDSLNHQMLNISKIQKPVWVSKQPYYTDNKYHYGIGNYTLKANENDAWRTAEEKAIFNIMSYHEIEVYNINIVKKINDLSHYEKLNMIKINYSINNIDILKRWRDISGKNVYVLVRIKKSDLIKRGN